MNSPGPTATDIQTHLYNSFIQGSTYDVTICVSGNWTALYKLHRVVLIQSGFFRSLFTAGFVESKAKRSRGADEIHVTFDDYNITRPAFEICISRLYGGGPPLHVSPNLIATTNNPLTPPFSGVIESDDVPPGHQPANHRFLLSLLATSIYLSIPSVASQSLTLILKTVGPTTVLDYLNFACGKSLTYSNPLPEDSRAAVGLENVGLVLDDDDLLDGQSTTKSIQGLKSLPLDASQASVGDGSPDSEESEAEDPSSSSEPCYRYGAVSDKIGEACACWLARWATDLLPLEDTGFILPDSRLRSKSVSSVISNKLSASLSSSSTRTIHKTPVLWGRGGLTAKWVATLVSADTLFIKNERERYNFAKTVVELRRRDGVLPEEEVIWTDMFEQGIHYVNMPFDDIHYIGQDISPTTRRPYVSIPTLQAAHWSQSVLKHAVTSRPYSPSSSSTLSGNSSPPPRDKELGVAVTTADILSKLSNAPPNDPERLKPYYPVFVDQSIRVGDGGTSATTTSTGAALSMEELFSPFHNPAPRQPRASNVQEPIPSGSIVTTEDKFFGLFSPRMVAQDCIDSDPHSKAKWSPYPPYRFSVEFWDVDLLKEKSRLHSQTIWYAGSLFNVYVQLVRKKNQAQLGIYLHRQSHIDPLPAASVPPSTANREGSDSLQFQPSTPYLPLSQSPQIPNHYSPSIHPVTSRTGTPPQRNGTASSPPSPSSSPPIGSAPFILSASPSTLSMSPPQHNYRDPRSAISAYFSISCASATGSSQTRFSSSPDNFTVSQSWGWKSSSLRTEEFLELGTQPLPSSLPRGKEVSLRATVVLGLV